MATPRPSSAPADHSDRHSAEAFVHAVVGAWAWRISVAFLLSRASVLAAIGLSSALVIVILDHLVPGGLPRFLIAGAGFLLVVTVLGVLLSLLTRAIRGRVNPAFAARAAERSREIPHNLLLNAVVIADSGGAAYARPAAVTQAAAALDVTHEKSGELLTWRGLAWPAAAALAWILYALIAAKPVLPSVLRMLGWNLAAPTATHIERIRPAPGDALYAGRPLEFEFRLSGRAAADFTFEQLNDDGTVRQRQSPGRAPGEGDQRRVSLSAQEVSGTLHYRARAGDGVLEESLRTTEPPRVVQMRVDLTPPEYTGEAARTVIDGDITAWLGTRARVTIQSAGEIREAQLIVQGREESRTRMEIAADDATRATVALTLNESGDYWIALSDTHGTNAENPLRRRITVRVDAAPNVRITDPETTRGEPIDVSKVARLAAVARDDIHLAGVWFVQEQAGQTQRTELTRGGATLGTTAETGFPLAQLNLNVGQSARVWFEAGDTRHLPDGTPAPQLGQSPVLTIVRSAREIAHDDVPDPGKAANAGGGNGRPGGDRGTAKAAGGDAPGGAGEGKNGAGTGGQGAAAGKGQPGDGGASAGSDQPGEKGDGDAPGAGEGQGEGEGEFEARLKDFVAKHGEDARKLNEGDSGARAASGEGEGGNGESSGTSGAAAERKEARARSNEEEDVPPNAPMNATDQETPADSQNSEKPEPPEAAEKDNPDSQPAEKSREPAGAEKSTKLPRSATQPSAGSQPASQPDSNKPEAGKEKDQNAGQNSDKPDGAESRPSGEDQRNQVEPDPIIKREGTPPEAPDSPAVVEMPPDPAPPEPAQDGANPAPEEGEMRGSPALDKRAERVDVLDMLARGEPPREEDLIALGWPEARRLEFMKDFERLRNSARKAGVIGPTGEWRGQALYGADYVARGEKRGENVGEKVDRGVSLDDGLSQIARPPDAAVPTSLRPVLDAYYRALAKRRTASSQPVHD